MKTHLLFLAAALLLITASPAMARLEVGSEAPDFAASKLDGQAARLSDLRGETLLIELGTTWCSSCNELARQIDTLRDYLKGRQIRYISIFLADSATSIRQHQKEEGLLPPDLTLIDSGEARKAYGVFSIPRLILIDPEMRIVFDEMTLESAVLKKRIESYLKQATPADDRESAAPNRND